MEPIPAETNRISGFVVEAAIEVHRELGPGLLETIYRTCLADELTGRGLSVEQEVVLPVFYKGKLLDRGMRPDLLVERTVVVELKAADAVLPIHRAQLLTYLRLGRFRVGLLMNFNATLLKNGIERFAL